MDAFSLTRDSCLFATARCADFGGIASPTCMFHLYRGKVVYLWRWSRVHHLTVFTHRICLKTKTLQR